MYMYCLRPGWFVGGLRFYTLRRGPKLANVLPDCCSWRYCMTDCFVHRSTIYKFFKIIKFKYLFCNLFVHFVN